MDLASWEQTVNRVVDRVYKVQAEKGSKTIRVLHRNLLLPVNELPLEENIPAQNHTRQPEKQQTKTEQQSEKISESDDEDYMYTPPSTLRLERGNNKF